MFVVIITLILLFSGCSKENPVEPKNQSPEIIFLEVFPKTIGPLDSVIVMCNAIDPDGDTLFYDWITDGRLKIKGSNYTRLYHTLENTRVFYPKLNVIKTPIDTPWVQCFVRDGRGEADAEMVRFYVKSD